MRVFVCNVIKIKIIKLQLISVRLHDGSHAYFVLVNSICGNSYGFNSSFYTDTSEMVGLH